jgi:hypothetical protein
MSGTSELVAGSLVQWPSAPGAPLGVVTEVDGLRVHVRFDRDADPKIFNAKTAAVRRVQLSGMVRLRRRARDRPRGKNRRRRRLHAGRYSSMAVWSLSPKLTYDRMCRRTREVECRLDHAMAVAANTGNGVQP